MPLILLLLAAGALAWWLSMPRPGARLAWLARVWPIAKIIEGETGVKAKIWLAHWAHETGYGTGSIFKATNNPGSIVASAVNPANAWAVKDASGAWRALPGREIYVGETKEVRNGVAVIELRPFRNYPDILTGARDLAKLISTSPRYSAAFEAGKRGDLAGYAAGLQAAGYATYGYGPEFARNYASIDSGLA